MFAIRRQAEVGRIFSSYRTQFSARTIRFTEKVYINTLTFRIGICSNKQVGSWEKQLKEIRKDNKNKFQRMEKVLKLDCCNLQETGYAPTQ